MALPFQPLYTVPFPKRKKKSSLEVTNVKCKKNPNAYLLLMIEE